MTLYSRIAIVACIVLCQLVTQPPGLLAAPTLAAGATSSPTPAASLAPTGASNPIQPKSVPDSRNETPAFTITAGVPRWVYFASGAGAGSEEFPPPKYVVEVPVKMVPRGPLPEGKTPRDYVVNSYA